MCEGGEIKKGLDTAGGAEDAQGAAAQNPVKRFSIIPEFTQEMRTPSRWLAYLTGVLQEIRKEAEQEGPLTQEGGARLDGQSGEDGKPPDYKGGNRRARWLKRIDGQIEWLGLIRLAAQKTESAEMEAKVAPLHLPSQEAMEKLRRYEGMLERQARAWSHERREAPQNRSGTLPPRQNRSGTLPPGFALRLGSGTSQIGATTPKSCSRIYATKHQEKRAQGFSRLGGP